MLIFHSIQFIIPSQTETLLNFQIWSELLFPGDFQANILVFLSAENITFCDTPANVDGS